MSRSGYSDDCDGRDLAMWRGQVASAIRGKRGQTFLREMIEALDAMTQKRLIAREFWNGEACALGVMAQRRANIDPISIEPEEYDRLAELFGVAHQLIQEVEFMNDEFLWQATPEARWQHMRDWAAKNLKDALP